MFEDQNLLNLNHIVKSLGMIICKNPVVLGCHRGCLPSGGGLVQLHPDAKISLNAESSDACMLFNIESNVSRTTAN